MKILVVCGAGASSTFVAQRINSAARTRKLAYVATATDEASLADRVGSSELILLGPHLAPHLQDIRGLAALYGVPVVLLDADVFSDFDGTRSLAQVEAALSDEST